MKILRMVMNFLIDQRWAVLVLLIYAVLMGAALMFLGGAPDADEIRFHVKEHGMLAVFFGASLASNLIYDDLKSRRITSVLSKAVSRYEYLLAVALSCWMTSAVYVGAAIVIPLGFSPASFRAAEFMASVLGSILLALLAICAVVCFGSFVHPLIAISLTAISLLGPAALPIRTLPQLLTWLSPAFVLGSAISNGRGLALEVLLSSVIHIAGWFVLAWTIFDRRDIAMAVD